MSDTVTAPGRRGVRPCPHGERFFSRCPACRRAYHRERARRRRAASLAATARGLRTCPKRHGPGVCGAVLEAVVDRATGRAYLSCPRCERQARGICRDCPRPVAGTVGKALRCAEHKDAARAAQVRASEARHHEARRVAQRERYRADEARRQAKLEYKRAWRKANPEKVRKQKRRAALRQPERVYDYMARYRRKHREHYREMARRAYYAAHPDRPHPPCTRCGVDVPYEPPGAPYTTCDAHCSPHQLRRRRAKRARIAETQAVEAADREAAFVAAGKPPKPKPLRRPKAVARRAATGDRYCVTDGCASVVRGREKKCAGCKAADRARAAQLLADRRGRGRRTDLERARAERAA